MKRRVVLEETYKRLKTANKLATEIQPCKAVLLAGSVAYGAYYSVMPESDLELICIVDEQDSLKNNFLDEIAAKYLHSGEADIYKKNLPGYEFPTYLIFWTSSFFEKICSDLNFEFGIRFSKEDLSKRKDISKRKVQLNGFHGHKIIFPYKCKKTENGYLTKYPVHYIEQGLYYFAGVPVENLLSNPQVLAGDKHYINENIDLLWKMLVERISSEIGGPGDDPFFENLLFRKDRMPPSLSRSFIEKENNIRQNQLKIFSSGIN